MERTYLCPCGDRLWTREQLRAEDDEMAQHIAEAYLDDRSAYCAGEDDVVPLEYARGVLYFDRRPTRPVLHVRLYRPPAGQW
jgi:hypothetical protein